MYDYVTSMNTATAATVHDDTVKNVLLVPDTTHWYMPVSKSIILHCNPVL